MLLTVLGPNCFLKEICFKLCYIFSWLMLMWRWRDISNRPINPSNKDPLETPWNLILGGFWCAKIKTAATHSKEPHLPAPLFYPHTFQLFCSFVFKCLPADVGFVAWHVLASDQGVGERGCGWEEEGEEPRWDEQPSYQGEDSQSLIESGHNALDDHLVTSLSPVSKPISCLKPEGRRPAKIPQPYLTRG